MKVAIFSPFIMRTYGGMERASYWLYRSLESRGIDTTLLVLSYKENEPNRYSFEKKPKTVVVDLGPSKQKMDALKTTLQNGGYDCVIVFACHRIAPYICDALNGTKIPWVYAERTYASHIEATYGKICNNPKERRQQIIKNCQAMVLQLEAYKQSVPEPRRHKLVIIPNACGIKNVCERKLDKNKKILLSLGRLENNQKQISLLIDAFDSVSTELREWELHIYGSGPDENYLKQLAKSKKNSQKIKFMGISKDPFNQYSTSDIFCLPSKFEGFPNTVVEAFTCSLPVIAFKDCVATNSIITDGYNGLLADKMNATSLAETLKKAMGSESLINKLSTGAFEESKKYDENVILNKWMNAINMAMKNRNHTENKL